MQLVWTKDVQNKMREEQSEAEMARKAISQARLQSEDAAAAIAQKQRRADKVCCCSVYLITSTVTESLPLQLPARSSFNQPG